MKSFQTIKESLSVRGMSSNRSKFNKELIKTGTVYYLTSIISIAYLFCEAKTFIEFTQNIYITSSVMIVSYYFTFFISKMEKFFELIQRIEKIFDKSKFYSCNWHLTEKKVDKILFRIKKSFIESNFRQKWSNSRNLL